MPKWCTVVAHIPGDLPFLVEGEMTVRAKSTGRRAARERLLLLGVLWERLPLVNGGGHDLL